MVVKVPGEPELSVCNQHLNVFGSLSHLQAAAQKLAATHAGHKDISISLAAYLDVVLQAFCDNIPKISHQRLVVEVSSQPSVRIYDDRRCTGFSPDCSIS